jgi:phage terminase large subunit
LNEIKLKLSPRQLLGYQILEDPQVVDILWGGGAGGGKSLLACIWMILRCRNFPGIRIGLGRKEITKLKQTTLVTLLREAHPILNVKDSEFNYNDQKGTIEYINGSSIQLIDLARQPSDPNYDRFGSLNFTDAVAEEIAEVDQKARDTFFSRKNRYLNKEYGIVGKSLSTCNPSQNWVKREYYEPYKNLGGGASQKWEHGSVFIKGEKKPAYRAFVRSLAIDNPFLDLNYIETLRQMAPTERRRLLEGDWNFADADSMLFKAQNLDRANTGILIPGKKAIGVDIADAGKDKTVITLIESGIIADQRTIQPNINGAIGEQIAEEIIRYAMQHGFAQKDARGIAIDSLGVGASTRDFLRQRGWYVREFVAGATSLAGYKNLRSEMLWLLSQAIEHGEIKIYDKLPYIDKIRAQLMAFEFETEERTLLVKSKKLIKQQLGESPDYAESAYIAFWAYRGDTNPKNNPNRIVL